MQRMIPRPRAVAPGLLTLALVTASGCATYRETYYLMARDQSTQTTNIFRVIIDGQSATAKIKYSAGLYDKDAIDRLFSENSLRTAYLSGEISVFDDETGKRLGDLTQRLAQARLAREEERFGQLDEANATLARLLGTYQTRLLGKDEWQLYRTAVENASSQRGKAEKDLTDYVKGKKVDPSLLISAESALRQATAALQAIRVLIDGKVLVRFFDGDGNELDVNNRKLVIFVASDVSRFSEAIRQLADASETTNDILRTVMGGKIQEADALARRMRQSDQQERALLKRLNTIVDNASDADDVGALILRSAAAAAGSSARFENAAQIDAYLRGRSGR